MESHSTLHALQVSLTGRELIAAFVRLCKEPDGQEGILTDSFTDNIHGIVSDIQSVRAAQNLPLYSDDNIRTLIHLGVVAVTAHRKKTRKVSGRPYFDEHLIGAVHEDALFTGETELEAAGASLCHDLIEDTEVKTFAVFFKWFNETFKDENDQLKQRIFRPENKPSALFKNIWSLVESLTKVEADDHSEQSVMTARKLLAEIAETGTVVLRVKATESMQNLRSLAQRGDKERINQIADNTYEVFSRLAEIFRLISLVREQVDILARIINIPLLEDFNEARDERIGQRQHAVMYRLWKIFGHHKKNPQEMELLACIDSLYIEPTSLGEVSLRSNKGLGDLELDDVVSALDPLYQVKVLVMPGTDIDGIKSIIKKYGLRINETSSETSCDPAADPPSGAYLTLRKIEGPGRTGTIVFNINDTVSAARAKRGVVECSGDLSRRITRLLEHTQHNIMATIPRAKEMLFKPPIEVYTPGNNKLTFVPGSTGHDFAAEVHTDYMARIPELWACVQDETGRVQRRRLDIFDELPHGATLELIIREDSPKADAGCRLFCATEKADGLYQKVVLNKGSREFVAQNGREYISKLAELFLIDATKMITIIQENLYGKKRPHDEDDFYRKVQRGIIEPVSILARTFYKDRHTWNVRIGVSHDEVGVLERTASAISHEGVYINRVITTPYGGPGKPHEMFFTLSGTSFMRSPFDLMRLILRLTYSYRVQALPPFK